MSVHKATWNGWRSRPTTRWGGVMSTTYRSFAKINLHLEVVGRRSDGFHELRTLFQTVSLCDLIEVGLEGRGVGLEAQGLPVPEGAANLAHQAAEAYIARWGDGRGVRLSLRKRIPVQGGLGGGSSNAATVLLALRDLLGEPAEIEDLVMLAARLGADVPYFLVGGTALGRGRGDEIEILPDLEEETLWLVHPAAGLSTAQVFGGAELDYRTERHALLDAVVRGEVRRPSEAVGVNDLEPAVLALSGAVKEVYTSLVQFGAERVRVSGSGATVFTFRPGVEDERELLSSLPARSGVSKVQTLSRASITALRVVDSLEGP